MPHAVEVPGRVDLDGITVNADAQDPDLDPDPPRMTPSRVRPATPADVPAIVAMGATFIETEYPGAVRFNPAQLATLAEALMAGTGSVVFVVEADAALLGMMALQTYAHPMSGDTIATELVWWVNPAARGGRAALQLLDAADRWARQQGATMLQMIAPSDKVARFYARVGFDKIETHYQRRL